MIGLNVFPKQC